MHRLLKQLVNSIPCLHIYTFCISLLHFALFSTISAAPLEDWRARTIYQVITDRYALANGSLTQPCDVDAGLYCGGSWKGIQNHLDYIQGMNFDAIWISPIVGQLPGETADGEAYTAYWQQDLYTLNNKFGTVEDFQDLVSDVHTRGMYLMLDVVVNHFGYAGSPDAVDYSVFNPFNDSSYFHPFCQIDDYANQTDVEVCWLGDENVPLVDLRTEDAGVQNMYAEWIRGLVANHSIDGLRIDSSINVNHTFFPDFVEAAGVFATGEVMTGEDSLACTWAESIGSILNYPLYYPLVNAFSSPDGSIGELTAMMNAVQANCPSPTALGLFSENHDVPRFANMTSDMALAQNVITYTLMGDGIPIVYQGQEQHMNGGITPFYTNRAPLWNTGYNRSAPLYVLMSKLVSARKHMIKTDNSYVTSISEVIYQDYHSLSMRKGVNDTSVITVLTNNGADADDWVLHLDQHGLSSDTYVTEILSCDFFVVNRTGFLNVPMGRGQPKVFIPSTQLPGSGLCGLAQDEVVSATVITDVFETTVSGHPTIATPAITEAIVVTIATTTVSAALASGTTRHSGGAMARDADTAALIASFVLAMVGLP